MSLPNGFGMQKAVIVCCIESGPLEAQVSRLARSIRKYGGQLSDAPIVAVRPRLGPSIARTTRQALDKLEVEVVERRVNRTFAWQHYTNKAHALLVAEEVALGTQYIWLDSDVMILADPSDHLILRPGEDFAACAPDRGAIGSSGPEDPNDAIWHRACGALGVDVAGLPWVTTCTEGSRIRFYLNSGVFTYGRATGFADSYADDCIRYLEAKTSKTHSEVHFSDQIVLGICAHRMGLNWKLLPHSHNYACHSELSHWLKADELLQARILHYHDMMEPRHWLNLLGMITAAGHPLRNDFEKLESISDPSSYFAKSAREVLRILRGAK